MDSFRIDTIATTDRVTRDDNDKIEIAFARRIADVLILVAEFISFGTRVRCASTRKIRNTEVESKTIRVI